MGSINLLRVVLAAALCGLTFRVSAALPDEIQVYDGEISEVGEFSVDLHLNYSFKGVLAPDFQGERITNHGLRITPEFNYGLTKTVDVGLYVPTIYTPTYGYESAGYKLRAKWLPLQEKNDDTFSAGVSVEYGSLKAGMEQPTKKIEYRFIVAKESSDWKLALNPILANNLSDGYSKTPEFRYSLQILKKRAGDISEVGFEYYHSMGTYNNFLPSNQQAKTIFLVMNFETKLGWFNDWDFHWGIGRGWSSADPWIMKMIISPKIIH
jgi:hypothetical protein